MALPIAILGGIVGVIEKVVERAIPDKDQAAKLKQRLTLEMLKMDSKELEAATQIIVAEAKGDSWLQRSWRPILMLWFAALVGAYWLGWTAPNLDVSTVNSLLDLVQIGIGGYVIGRTGEKIVKTGAEAAKNWKG